MAFLFKLLIRYYWVLLISVITLQAFLLKGIKSEKKDLKNAIELSRDEITHWKSKNGESYAKIKALEIEARNAKLILGKSKVAELRKEVGNVKKNLISYKKISTTTKGSLSIVVHDTTRIKDSVRPIKKVSFEDAFFTIEGSYNPLSDSLIASYCMKHNFEIFHYYERPGKPPFNIFQRKHAVVKIKFENPKSDIESAFTINLKLRRKLSY